MNKIIDEISLSRLFKYFIFGIWELVFRILPYSPLRVWWLKLGGAQIGRGSVIDRIEFMNLDRRGLLGLKIGNQCYLGVGVLLDLADEIILADQVTIAARSIILTHRSVGFNNHPLIQYYPKLTKKVILNNGCVVGIRSIILPGVVVGRQSLIGASSLVRQNVPEKVLAAGIPAQVKKHLK